MEVAIIGSGYTGMTIAKRLIENGLSVTIFEKDEKVGGMTTNIEIENIVTDKHYRHLFKSDKYLIQLAQELGVDITWFKGKMGYCMQSKLYDWGQPISLLKFKPLNFIQKMRFGMSVIKLKTIKKAKSLENCTIEEWYKRNGLEDIYKIIWKPLLHNKFGIYATDIPMIYLWSKMNLRKTDSNLNEEKLGYIDNFEEMNQKMQSYLMEKGVKFYLNNKIHNIEKIGDKYTINHEEKQYDIVISTISYEETKKLFDKYLTKEEKEKLIRIKYISAKTMIMVTKKRLTDYYWLNINDTEFPFCGIIDYHNMKNIKEVKNIIYISNYIENSNPINNLEKEELLQRYMPYLQEINKDFKREDILNYVVVDEKYAQSIIELNYSEMLLSNKLSESGLYVDTLPQIYPEDRGVNYAIRNGYKLADEIIQDIKK